MQIMYVLVFLVSLMVLGVTADRDDAVRQEEESVGVALQMGVWHTTSLKACIVSCAGGLQDPREGLDPQFADAPAFRNELFVTRYDNMSGRVVTWMNPARTERGTVSYGSVAAALQKEWRKEGQTTSMGVWDSATSRVVYSYPPPSGDTGLQLPSPFAGGSIPNGSPVMVSNSR